MTVSSRTVSRAAIVLGFALVLLIGLCIAGDYALSQDEVNMHHLASDAYGYITGNNPWPVSDENRFHGPFVELTIFGVQRLLGVTNLIALTTVRHAVAFTIFWLGTIAFFFLCKRHFKSIALAALGAAFLFVTPRIFAHAFYNSRDVPFLALFTFAILTLTLLLDHQKIPYAVLHGIACAMAISTRVMGILLPAITGLFLFLAYFAHTPDGLHRHIRRITILGLVTLFCTCAFTFVLWPLLWGNPVRYFLDAVAFGGSFTGYGFYFGESITGLPWHYVPVWIGITAPVLYSFFALIGLGSYASTLWRLPLSLRSRRNEWLFLLWFVLPIAAVTAGAGIYNEWRHVFFIYPAFLLISLEGVRTAYHLLSRSSPRALRPWLSAGLTTIIVLCMAKTVYWMQDNHPMQGLYFSVPTSWVDGKFDLDYWGVSSRLALDIVTAVDQRQVIPIEAPGITLINANLFYPDRKLFKPSNNADADYIIDKSYDPAYRITLPRDRLVGSVVVDNLTIARVYRGPHWDVR